MKLSRHAPPKAPIEEVAGLGELKAGDQIVAIRFYCEKCGRAEAYTSIRVNEITHRRIYTITQSRCANAPCREESGLNYWPGKGGDRVTKVEYLCDALESLHRDSRITAEQIGVLKAVLKGRNLRLIFTRRQTLRPCELVLNSQRREITVKRPSKWRILGERVAKLKDGESIVIECEGNPREEARKIRNGLNGIAACLLVRRSVKVVEGKIVITRVGTWRTTRG